MKKVLVFGTGISAKKVLKNIKNESVEVIGFLDNNKKKQGEMFEGQKICAPEECLNIAFDLIIIASVKYEIITEQLVKLGIQKEKVISYFAFEHEKYGEYSEFIRTEGMIFDELEKKYDDMKLYIHEMEYAVADKLKKGTIQLPNILSIDETIDRIIEEKLSVSRYGDGEYDLILGKKINFQKESKEIGKRMQEILVKPIPNHMVALADIYGDLSYTIDKYATFWRNRLYTQREKQYRLLDMNREYGNAFITRFYSEMKDKSDAKRRFERMKKIWQNRDVVLIEGEFTRFGVGNDLLDNAQNVRRILCPNESAFDAYDEIMDACRKIDNDALILVALGPTATVMAYDLAKEGYQAIDIGHLDLEYEWYLRGVEEEKVVIEGKYTNEVVGGNVVIDVEDEKYQRQIVERVGC